MAKSLKIIISFKQEEIGLYNFVKGKRNGSCYIKDLIEKDIKGNSDNKPVSKVDNDSDLGFDF